MLGRPGLWRIDWFGKWGLPKALLTCPKCGTRLVTYTVFYECPGCGYTKLLPAGKRYHDRQPIDGLAYKVAIDAQEAREPIREDLAALVPPTELDAERGRLCTVGGWFTFALAMQYILDSFPVQGEPSHQALHVCWGVMLLAVIPLTIALLSASTILKELAAVACIPLTVVCAYTLYLLYAVPELWVSSHHFESILIPATVISGSVYYLWLAWFLLREASLMRTR